MLYLITVTILDDGPVISSTWQLFLTLLSYTTICPIMPRFIISVRELYDRDLRARWQGIDTGFGVLSQPIASQNMVEELGDGAHQVVESGHADIAEVIRLEALGDGTHQV